METAWFLTGMKHNPVFCCTSNPFAILQITGNLVKKKLRVQEQYIHQLPMDTECIVDGVKVVLLDANQ